MTKQLTFLRFLYVANLVGAGVPGALMILAPEWAKATMYSWPTDRFLFGVSGSIWLAIGLLSALGLKYPLQLAPVFLLQMLYKLTWIFGVGIPLAQAGLMEAWYYVAGFSVMTLLFAMGFPYRAVFQSPTVVEPPPYSSKP